MNLLKQTRPSDSLLLKLVNSQGRWYRVVTSARSLVLIHNSGAARDQ
jgi:hypothetical protein